MFVFIQAVGGTMNQRRISQRANFVRLRNRLILNLSDLFGLGDRPRRDESEILTLSPAQAALIVGRDHKHIAINPERSIGERE